MSIVQRVYPRRDSGQEAMLRTHIDHARFIFNLALEQRLMRDRAARERGVTVGYVGQARQLTELRAGHEWLRAGSTVVQQGGLRDFDRAITN